MWSCSPNCSVRPNLGLFFNYLFSLRQSVRAAEGWHRQECWSLSLLSVCLSAHACGERQDTMGREKKDRGKGFDGFFTFSQGFIWKCEGFFCPYVLALLFSSCACCRCMRGVPALYFKAAFVSVCNYMLQYGGIFKYVCPIERGPRGTTTWVSTKQRENPAPAFSFVPSPHPLSTGRLLLSSESYVGAEAFSESFKGLLKYSIFCEFKKSVFLPENGACWMANFVPWYVDTSDFSHLLILSESDSYE